MNFEANNLFPIYMQDSQLRGRRFLHEISSRRTGAVFLTFPKPAHRKVGRAQRLF